MILALACIIGGVAVILYCMSVGAGAASRGAGFRLAMDIAFWLALAVLLFGLFVTASVLLSNLI